jgi:AbrB family looped-hinge helix DNA binding protein
MYGGFIRDIDKAGRIVIPKQLRKELGINYEGAVVEMFYDGKQIILKKAAPQCGAVFIIVPDSQRELSANVLF